MKIVDVAYTAEEAKEKTGEAQELEAPKFPYGLSLYLDEQTKSKLGLGDVKVGDTMVIAGEVRVTGYSEREEQGGKKHSYCDLQITRLGVEGGGGKTAAQKVYPNQGKE